jgi:hypothetical protein
VRGIRGFYRAGCKRGTYGSYRAVGGVHVGHLGLWEGYKWAILGSERGASGPYVRLWESLSVGHKEVSEGYKWAIQGCGKVTCGPKVVGRLNMVNTRP